jgi:FKBP-type peptidyl-prolyl cis-trans isomerase
MKTGEAANIYCPAKTAYGASAQGKIPANSDLLFEVTVEKCKDMFA